MVRGCQRRNDATESCIAGPSTESSSSSLSNSFASSFVEQKSVEECMRDPIKSDPCLAVRNAYYNCKHGQLDMRKRIRGVRQS